MKKLISLLAVCALGVSFAAAQEGIPVDEQEQMLEQPKRVISTTHPAAGTIGVGIEADPILDYIGNMFNNSSSNNSRSHWGRHTPTIYLRYFLKANAAVRVRLNFRTTSDTYIRQVADQAALVLDPLSNKQVEDKLTKTINNYTIGVGYQMFRGGDRLKGFYGADVFYGFSNENRTWAWGNKMNALNPNPLSTTDFENLSTPAAPLAERDLTLTGSKAHTFGVNVFTGAEYYFIPQACIGFEVGVGLSGRVAGKGKRTFEKMAVNVYDEQVRTVEEGWASNVTFSTKVPVTYGNFYFVFHF